MKKKPKGKIEMISSGLNELETPIRQACNLAKALRMMSSSDQMSGEEGEGIFGVADALVELTECLQETRVEQLTTRAQFGQDLSGVLHV